MIKIQTQVLTLFLLMFVSITFTIYYNKKLKQANPLKASKGIMLIMEMLVKGIDNFVQINMGKKWVKNFAPYIGALVYLVFFGTAIGFIGITPLTSSLSVTLALGVVTFSLMQVTAIKDTKWSWFKRFAEPFPIFIPINIIAIWSPLISISLRLFASVLAGSIITAMGYGLTSWLTSLVGSPIDFLIVFIGPFFHAYFDLFAGLIQTIVFVSLTVIYISQEQK